MPNPGPTSSSKRYPSLRTDIGPVNDNTAMLPGYLPLDGSDHDMLADNTADEIEVISQVVPMDEDYGLNPDAFALVRRGERALEVFNFILR